MEGDTDTLPPPPPQVLAKSLATQRREGNLVCEAMLEVSQLCAAMLFHQLHEVHVRVNVSARDINRHALHLTRRQFSSGGDISPPMALHLLG